MLGHHAHVGEHRHEVDVAVPARHDVQVQVPLDAGARRRRPRFRPTFAPCGRSVAVERAERVVEQLPELRALLGVEVAGRRQVPVSARPSGARSCTGRGSASRSSARRDGARAPRGRPRRASRRRRIRRLVLGRRGLHVLQPPGRPEPLHGAVAYPRGGLPDHRRARQRDRCSPARLAGRRPRRRDGLPARPRPRHRDRDRAPSGALGRSLVGPDEPARRAARPPRRAAAVGGGARDGRGGRLRSARARPAARPARDRARRRAAGVRGGVRGRDRIRHRARRRRSSCPARGGWRSRSARSGRCASPRCRTRCRRSSASAATAATFAVWGMTYRVLRAPATGSSAAQRTTPDAPALAESRLSLRPLSAASSAAAAFASTGVPCATSTRSGAARRAARSRRASTARTTRRCAGGSRCQDAGATAGHRRASCRATSEPRMMSPATSARCSGIHRTTSPCGSPTGSA